ncbi:hypothetical protein [Micromonospora psammae]|uniref:hypothetical protein n=1 Tax=Micromonospora sp. CPCC 205556 TaxID=3122398 RepID=UPI002FEF03D1
MKIADRLDQTALDQLRSVLGLRPMGRLTDAWDELFGEASNSAAGKGARVELWRDVDDATWRIDVEFSTEVPEAVAQAVVKQVCGDVKAVGLQVSSVLQRHPADTERADLER